jgi:hypothetical protein
LVGPTKVGDSEDDDDDDDADDDDDDDADDNDDDDDDGDDDGGGDDDVDDDDDDDDDECQNAIRMGAGPISNYPKGGPSLGRLPKGSVLRAPTEDRAEMEAFQDAIQMYGNLRNIIRLILR